MSPFKIFFRKLLPWNLYVPACALPSFAIAYSYGFNTWPAVTGMALGAATCILLFAAAETLFLDPARHPKFHRTLHWTLRFRAAVAIAALIPSLSLLAWPDLLVGMVSMNAVETIQARGWLAFAEASADFNGMLVIYLMTMIGGFGGLLGVLLLMPVMHALITLCLRPVTTVAGDRTY